MTLILVLGMSNHAVASDHSEELIRQGAEDLRARNYTTALEKFTEATEIDPIIAGAWFLTGMALNRLGRHADAFARLEVADAFDVPTPRIDFEIGWAAVGIGAWKTAIERLERYEKARPGEAKTAEFLGRAYLGVGELDLAEQRLREAIERDPSVKETALYVLAQVESARGEVAASGEYLESLLDDMPQSRVAGALRDELDRRIARGRPEAKPWRLSFTAAGGYNNNVIALGDGIPLPVDISRQDSYFGHFEFAASYDWRLTENATLTPGYAFQSDVYSDVDGFDLIDHYFYVNYRRALRPDLVGALLLSGGSTLIDGDSFRNRIAARAGLSYRSSDLLSAELAYEIGSSNYLVATTAVRDRDSIGQRIGLTLYFALPNVEARGRAGYSYARNNADGADFDLDSHSVFVGLGRALWGGVAGEVVYSRTFDRYDDNNSLAGGTGFEFRRNDDTDRVTVRLTRPILDGVSIYGRFDYTRHESNINFFNYRQNAASVGLIARF